MNFYLLYVTFTKAGMTHRDRILTNDVMDVILDSIKFYMDNCHTTLEELCKLSLNIIQLFFEKTRHDKSRYKTIKKMLEIKNTTIYLDKLIYNKKKIISDAATVILAENWDDSELYQLGLNS